MNQQFASNDENVAPPIQVDDAVIGRQEKRVRLSLEMETHQDRENVTEATIGARRVGSVRMALRRMAADVPEAHLPFQAVIAAACGPEGEFTAMINTACAQGGAVRQAIAAECAQGGAVTQAIATACAQGGALTQAIATACAQGGAVTQAIATACAQGGAIHTLAVDQGSIQDRLNAARAYNQSAASPESLIVALPYGTPNNVPENFPRLVEDLQHLDGGELDGLLGFYHLQAGGTIAAKRLRLAVHCGVHALLL